MTKTRYSNGFTLPEVLVTVAIASILFVAVGIIMISTQGFWLKATNAVGLEDDFRAARTRMEFEIRNATGTFKINGNAATVSGNKLTFTSVGGSADDTEISLSAATSPANLLYKRKNRPSELLMANIQSLTFNRIASNGGIFVTVVARKTADYGSRSVVVSSHSFTVKCRNL